MIIAIQGSFLNRNEMKYQKYTIVFFAESHQAKRHRRDVTFHAVGKSRMWVTVGGSPG